MSYPLRLLVAGSFLILCTGSALAASGDVASRTAALKSVIEEQWQYALRESPEYATSLGDYRYNDRWSDYSLAHVASDRKANEAFLAKLEAIEPAGLAEQDRLDRQLLAQQLREDIEAIDLKLYEMPVDQFGGLQIVLPGLVATMPFDTVAHYEDYLARLNALPKVLADATVLMRKGRADRLLPPRFLLEKVAQQSRSVAASAGASSPFGQPLQAFPDAIGKADRDRLTTQIVAAIDRKVRPAYARFAAFVDKEYAPYGRETPGLWALPNGDRLYEFAVRRQTTTSLTPQAIHELGLREVERIEVEMSEIARKLGYRDLAALRAAVDHDPKLYAQSRAQILDAYRGYIAAMQPKLPELFGLLPQIGVEVRPVQEYREKEAAGAEYQPGTADGSRPGIVFVNTGDYAHRETMTIESTAYHEGVPGHHMQIAIAQKLPDLPEFRRNANYTAYVEGWALYAEQLGKDVGFYQDPYSDYGRLVGELLRADRLVLDTGVHYKHWTREQMISYFHAHPAGDEPTIEAETDRYIALPGQALAYKIGQLKFLELRERAKAARGASFDIRAFHDEMLDGGALPLDVLESRFGEWLAGPAH